MAPDVHQLAEELRLRGIRPWVDKQGGFSIGDQSASEARRAIREDCFGLMFYATRLAFTRPFIRKLEMTAALERKAEDSSFVLASVLRGLTFQKFKDLSIAVFGDDLSGYHSHRIPRLPAPPEAQIALQAHHREVSCKVLDRRLGALHAAEKTDVVGLQFSTRELLTDEPDDLLTIDTTWLLDNHTESIRSSDAWQRVHDGLLDIKQLLAYHWGRPRIRVHGSKHLTAAFMLGFVCPSTTGHLEIRTGDGYWATDTTIPDREVLVLTPVDGSVTSSDLFVEVSLTGKTVRGAVSRYIQRTGETPFMYLRGAPVEGTVAKGAFDAADACAIARQLRAAIGQLVAAHHIRRIHLFAAVPQGVAVMIGRALNAMPPVQLYEYIEQEYWPSFSLREAATQ